MSSNADRDIMAEDRNRPKAIEGRTMIGKRPGACLGLIRADHFSITVEVRPSTPAMNIEIQQVDGQTI
jgi:hypothetical protein